jgi:hypothetical protein
MMLLILNRISVVATAGWKQMKMILYSPVHVGGNGTHAVLVIGLYELPSSTAVSVKNVWSVELFHDKDPLHTYTPNFKRI